MWEWRYEGSQHFIQTLIRFNGGYGLTEKATGELLSFGTINDQLAVGILNTLPKARGKRYGELIAKTIAKRIAEKFEMNPTCFINNLNAPSINLFTKIGFKRICNCNWISVGGMGEQP